MKRFTDTMVKRELIGKGLKECICILRNKGITDVEPMYNSKGHPISLDIYFVGSDFQGFCTTLVFNKNSGLCLGLWYMAKKI